MTRTMYDSIRAANIKRNISNPQMVAGYVDQYDIPKWTTAEWAMFPNAVKVRIAKRATTNDGHILDVEDKLATPAQAPGWVKMRRAAGADPSIYVNLFTWPAVIAAFRSQRVAQPPYWIAQYDGKKNFPSREGITAVAKQYLGDTNGMDYSIVADHWPGVDGGNNMADESTVAAAVWNEPILNKSNGNLDPARVNQMWTLRGVDVANDSLRSLNDKVDKIVLALANQAQVSTKDIVDMLKPDFIAATKEIATDVAHLDENAVAEKLDQLIAKRFES
jgi:hypothetical protein